MTSHWITECPHCGTSFRVTEQHLRAAKGSVRCGSCLQIFNAIDTLFPSDDNNAADTAHPAVTASPITPANAPEPTPFVEDSPPTTPPPATNNNPIIEAFSSGAVEYKTLDPRKQWEDDQEEYVDEVVEHYAQNSSTGYLPPVDDTPTSEPAMADEGSKPAESVANPVTSCAPQNDGDDNYLIPDDTTPTEPIDEVTDDYLVPDTYHDESNNHEVEPAELISATDNRPTAPNATDDSFISAYSETPQYEGAWPPDHHDSLGQRENEPHIGPYREPFRDALLSELEADPPRGFEWDKPTPSMASRLLWGLLSLILVIVLAAQHVMFHYSDYATTLQNPPFDAWMHTLCEKISCRFIKTDLSLVANENLIIRTHPTETGFLVLDTMLFNRAPFEQLFPLLDLSFSDMQNHLIARRVFNPEEYLTGDLANLASMPMNTPLHISFAIKNPSDSATNYELKLIPSSR